MAPYTIPKPNMTQTQIHTMKDHEFQKLFSSQGFQRMKKLGRRLFNENTALDSPGVMLHCIEEVPELRKYEGLWPLKFYMGKYGYTKPKAQSQSCREATQQSIRRNNNPETNQAAQRASSSNSGGVSQNSSARMAGMDAGPSCPPRSSRAYPQNCIFCGFQSPIPRWAEKHLKAVFNGDINLKNLLARVGIEHDLHFLLLLQMPLSTRAHFIASALGAHTTPFSRIVLETRLEQTNIFNVFFADASDTITEKLIMAALHLKGHEYANLTASDYFLGDQKELSSHMSYHLDLRKSLEDQEPDQLNDMFNSICDEFPEFRDVTDNWPLKALAKHFLKSRKPVQSSAGLRPNNPGPTLADEIQSTHSCPKGSICSQANGESFAKSLCENLLGELVPAFSLLGITSDNDFLKAISEPAIAARLKRLIEDIVAKRSNVDSPHITPFQGSWIQAILDGGLQWLPQLISPPITFSSKSTRLMSYYRV
ncbi:hypothetical protein C8R43DRAFT_946851 [Mycena crocata]|nr:hypothetical protein C8R43DRAFT_946851 [Mycena crocata]